MTDGRASRDTRIPAAALVLGVLLLLLCACSSSREIPFDIPAGSAAMTLKEFARQSGLEIVYTARSVEGVTTNPLHGAMQPRQGLEQLLKGTPLFLQEDPVSGAFAVMRTSGPLPPGAAGANP